MARVAIGVSEGLFDCRVWGDIATRDGSADLLQRTNWVGRHSWIVTVSIAVLSEAAAFVSFLKTKLTNLC